MFARPAKAFTLVELVIVILLLAILAGVAFPRVVDSVQLAAERAWVSQLLVFIAATERFHAETGLYPSDGDTGQLPAELLPYLREESWTAPTPIGGRWDFETGDSGVDAGLGVHFKHSSPPAAEVFERLDASVDDGDPGAGSLRWIERERFYFVFE